MLVARSLCFSYCSSASGEQLIISAVAVAPSHVRVFLGSVRSFGAMCVRSSLRRGLRRAVACANEPAKVAAGRYRWHTGSGGWGGVILLLLYDNGVSGGCRVRRAGHGAYAPHRLSVRRGGCWGRPWRKASVSGAPTERAFVFACSYRDRWA